MTTIKIKQWNGTVATERLVHAEKTIDNGNANEIKSLSIALLVKYKELVEGE